MLIFAEGEWIYWKTVKWNGFVEEVGVGRCKVAFPQPDRVRTMYVQNHELCKIGSSLTAEDISALTDMALNPVDEEWLRELALKRDNVWRKQNGINS